MRVKIAICGGPIQLFATVPTPGYSYLSLLYSPLSAFTQGCIVVMRYIRLCIISLLATLPLA
ncbi:hypothetical protein ACWYRO_29560, partial [Klebsiella pneumoniae]|nr:hypothetical protein [Klebsiella pneumoniae]MDS7745706.1 hypothetical protein [Klebsiella pneumoniae]MDS7990818.1 hypothetical protein [Klebsiella pneumoniae]